MDKLKPCPFCGGQAMVNQTAYGTTDLASCKLSFSIGCQKCGATAPKSRGFIAINLSSNGDLNIWHDDRTAAIEAWNRRVSDA